MPFRPAGHSVIQSRSWPSTSADASKLASIIFSSSFTHVITSINNQFNSIKGLLCVKWFHWICNWKNLQTRMHSNGMRTARLLTVSQHALHRRGCLPSRYLSRGVSTQGGWCLPGGGGIPACNGAEPPLWTDRHLWKHNLRKLRLRAVTKSKTL